MSQNGPIGSFDKLGVNAGDECEDKMAREIGGATCRASPRLLAWIARRALSARRRSYRA
jgi:hypothetical protein